MKGLGEADFGFGRLPELTMQNLNGAAAS